MNTTHRDDVALSTIFYFHSLSTALKTSLVFPSLSATCYFYITYTYEHLMGRWNLVKSTCERMDTTFDHLYDAEKSTLSLTQALNIRGCRTYTTGTVKSGVVLHWGRGHVPPRFTCCPPPQLQKLAGRSDVIFEVQKYSKIQNPRTPLGAYSAPPEPLADGRGLAAPPKNPTSTLHLISTGLRV